MTTIVLGPPGTGKTTWLLNRVSNLIASGTPPDRIAYFSFTRRAAEEAVTRASAQFNLTSTQLPHFRTLHSMCFRALGITSRDVFEGTPIAEFAEWAHITVTGKTWSEDGTLTGFSPGDRMLFLENLARIRCVSLSHQFNVADEDLSWGEMDRVARALVAFKASNGLMDFTDMITEVLRRKLTLDIDHLIVDEAQDLSPLQWRLVRQLAQDVESFAVAGDDDQAIYRWAGAEVSELIDLEGDTEVLGQSYRVPSNIQAVADRIIAPIHHRRPKRWNPRSAGGEITNAFGVTDLPLDDQWSDDTQPILVLARNTYVLREHVEPELRRMGVLYEWRGRPSLDRKTVKAVITWEHLRAGRTAEATDVRVVYAAMSPGRGVLGEHRELPGVPDDAVVTLDQLKRDHGLRTDAIWSDALDRLRSEEVQYIVAARQRGEHLLGKPRVRLSTIHAAKGGEADHVVLMREMARRTHDEMLEGEEDERRVWYVAVTRAKEKLTVVEGTRMEGCPWV